MLVRKRLLSGMVACNVSGAPRRFTAVCVVSRQRVWCSSGAAAAAEAEPKLTSAESAAACERVTKVGAVANVALCGLKGAAGVASGSSAMVADAFHSLGDLVSDGVTLAAIRYSRAEPDDEYPFGKGKVESLGALCVSGLLVGTGLGIGASAWQALMSPVGCVVMTNSAALLCGVASVLVKEWLYRATVKAGKEAGSSVTVANAHHHRSDAFSSVVAVVGIAGNMCGLPWLDPLAGAGVACMILKTGGEIGLDAVRDLTDRSPEQDPELLDLVERVCREHGVKTSRSAVATRQMGPFVSLYMPIYVKATISISNAAKLSTLVRSDILRQSEAVQSCFITTYPQVRSSESAAAQDHSALPAYEAVKQDVLKVLEDHPLVQSVTHFTPHYLGGHVSINLEVTMGPEVETIAQAATVARSAEKAIVASISYVNHTDIHLELRGLHRRCSSLSVDDGDAAAAALPKSHPTASSA
eukprot:Rhum_TRINITY_DN21558_c0_g1::Rhum_TRINITY_DN21558_c0_g1_i1::g.174260::m.174260